MKNIIGLGVVVTLLMLTVSPTPLGAWPVDGYPQTGIRRLEQPRLIAAGELKGTRQPAGGLWPTEAVDIRLSDMPAFDLPAVDAALGNEIIAMLGDKADRYGVAVLDPSDPNQPVYAEYRGDYHQNVGSVGKLLGALGFFQALVDTYPDDVHEREQLMRNTVVTADRFAHTDHHAIRLFNVDTRTLVRRPMQDGDTGNLWEYLDWTLSVSSNSAAAMTMRDAMLLRQFGEAYPLPDAKISPFFDGTPGKDKTALFQETFWQPVTRNGLSLNDIRQGSFFTREGKRLVAGGGLSYASARSLMQYLLLMEQGQLVDEWSSRALKRLLYMTERRIRYASSPALRDAAVYFKSGSLYSCQAEEGFKCGKYKGNKRNYMNSVAIVEADVEGKRLHYIVTLVSNVLRENSAVAHQTLGTKIHQLMKQRHAVAQ
jgi:acid stress-induced BolA-like protein IbaG/YrbA